LKQDVSIISLEKDARVYRVAKMNIKRTPHAQQICCYNVDAVEWLKDSIDTFDYIFVDGRKREYGTYLELCADKLKKGGVIIFDDTFFTLEPIRNNTSKELYRILLGKRLLKFFNDFNAKFARDSRFVSYFLRISHGLTVGIKK